MKNSRMTTISRGVALVAVLSVLTTLAMLAAAFAVMMSLETASSRTTLGKLQVELVTRAGLEHAEALLRHDAWVQPAWDDYSETWWQALRERSGEGNEGGEGGQRWFSVRHDNGTLLGRYAVRIEDECGKINLNHASGLRAEAQHQGVGTFEILLTDGRGRGLPLSVQAGERLLAYRYGKDGKPGQAGVDDNFTVTAYEHDGIDNNANGVIDEPGEGIDEQEEFDSVRPRWDDRAFTSVREALAVATGGRELGERAYESLRQHATVVSRGRTMFLDPGEGKWSRQVNLNVGSRMQLLKMMRAANFESQFEPNTRKMRGLVANVIDYRDENHALTTMGDEYGVEGVCFNEILANDGSWSHEADHDILWQVSTRFEQVHRYGAWYNLPERVSGVERNGYKMEEVSAPMGGAVVYERGRRVTKPVTARIRLSSDPQRIYASTAYSVFKRIQRDAGGWLPGMWKNASLKVWTAQASPREFEYFPIVESGQDSLVVGFSDMAEYQRVKNWSLSTTNSVWIDTQWRWGDAIWCVMPEVSDYWAFPTRYDAGITPKEGLYYVVYIGEQNFRGNVPAVRFFDETRTRSGPWKGYNRMLDVDGDPSKYSEREMEVLRQRDLVGTTMKIPDEAPEIDLLRWAYQGGEPVRAKNGYIHVVLTSGRDTGYAGGMNSKSDAAAFAMKQAFDVVYVMRPDIVELINISDHPVSIRNWQVVINTGSYADRLGLIDRVTLYSKARRGYYEDPNPVIEPRGYAYLTSNRKIFDYEFGGRRDGIWGGSMDEGYPCYELPDNLWGVRYKITSVRGNTIRLEGARWRANQMQYEMVEFHGQRRDPERNGPTGIRKSVRESRRDTLSFGQVDLQVDGIRPGDTAMIVGMPRQGGFLSMTLKNEYGQITARTVEYGSTERNEINYSTEKYDPTHYTWVKSPVPTFGGTERKARNHSFPTGQITPAHIKDNRFVSVGEIQFVRKSEDWENIGMEKRGKPTTRTLKAIARYFTVAGVRLDPEEPGAHVSGWRPAFGVVRYSRENGLVAEGVNWTPGLWDGQTLRMMSGAMRGDSFAIGRSTGNGIMVEGYSTRQGRRLNVKQGDQFSVGPGYATAMYYARQNGEEGTWEWKGKGLERLTYGLYLFGLSDAIDTTEFLEENYNAEIEVAVYNFETQQYDTLPLKGERRRGREAEAYEIVQGLTRHQYEKSDGVYCGQIHPQHISSEGGIRLKLTAYGLNARKASGFAWFDYAYLAPASVHGIINVNTASEAVLRALPKVTPELARAIATGTDVAGRPRLKPYRNISDILDVRGMTPEVFSSLCNLITVRSDQYRVVVTAEVIEDVNKNGTYEPEIDRVHARKKTDVLLDRSDLTDDDTGTRQFVVTPSL